MANLIQDAWHRKHGLGRTERMEPEIDPEFRALIPALSEQEYGHLEQNLMRDGCREPLSVWRNGRTILLDGHNRLKICQAHGMRFDTVEIKISDRDAAKIWIIENQFGRRNITPYQRCELALKLEPLYAKQAKERQRGGQGGVLLPQTSAEATETRKEVAKRARVSHDTIAKAKVIAERAPEPVKGKTSQGRLDDQQGV